MSFSANFVVLGGNLERDPEYYAGESPRCTFNIIVDNYLSEGKKLSDMFRCIGWGRTAEYLMKILQKGTNVTFQGSLHSRSIEDSNGVKRLVTEARVEKVLSFIQPSSKGYNNSSDDGPF